MLGRLTTILILSSVSCASAFVVRRSPELLKTPGILNSPRERPSIGKISAFLTPTIQLRNLRSSRSCSVNRKVGLRSMHGSTLVTYGDIWRNTLEELPNAPVENQVNLTIDNMFMPEHQGVSITGTNGMGSEFEVLEQRNGSSLQAVVRPVKKAATVMGAVAAGAAANLWSSLTQGPSEDEVNSCAVARIVR